MSARLFRVAIAWVLPILFCLNGCATVNSQTAARLAGEAQLTTRAIAESLEDNRRSLEIFVEGQALHGHLTGRSVLTPSELCSIKAVQRSLRLRVLLLHKLGVLYDSLIALAQYDSNSSVGIFDELAVDLDRYELLPDATPGPTCPDPEPAGQQVAPPPPPSSPGLLLGLSQSSSLRLASQRIRQVLGKFILLWDKERSIYLSIQRQALLSQKTLSRALFVKYGTVSPGSIFAQQMAGLGLNWNESAYREELTRWPPPKQQAVRDAVLAVLDRRAEHRIAEEEARYIQHGDLLRVLYRQHQVQEKGQPLDLRQIAWFLGPLLQAVPSATGQCTQ